MGRKRALTRKGMEIKMELLRQEKTATELASDLGYAASTISDVMTGYNKSKETLAVICESLGIKDIA